MATSTTTTTRVLVPKILKYYTYIIIYVSISASTSNPPLLLCLQCMNLWEQEGTRLKLKTIYCRASARPTYAGFFLVNISLVVVPVKNKVAGTWYRLKI